MKPAWPVVGLLAPDWCRRNFGLLGKGDVGSDIKALFQVNLDKNWLEKIKKNALNFHSIGIICWAAIIIISLSNIFFGILLHLSFNSPHREAEPLQGCLVAQGCWGFRSPFCPLLANCTLTGQGWGTKLGISTARQYSVPPEGA